MVRKIFLYAVSAAGIVLVPLFLIFSLTSALFLNDSYHVSIIKGLNLTETIIRLGNYRIESSIRNEIEKTTGISQFKPEYDRIKREYEEKLRLYDLMNKTAEYEKVEKEIDELDDMDWKDAPDTFKNEDDWQAWKKKKIKELKSARDAIEAYREKNEELIDKSKEIMKEYRSAFEEADDIMKDKEDEARDILEDRSGEFMNELVSDMSKISSQLSHEINTLFIETEVRKLIKTYLDFFTSYFSQKKTGNVYEAGLDIESGVPGSTKKVILPAFALNFNVKKDENGVIKEKNIFSGIAVDIIESTPGLKKPWVLSKIFGMADSWLTEKIAAYMLKGTGAVYSDGTLRTGPIALSGEKAGMVEKIMIGMTLAKFMIFVAPLLALMLVITVFILAPERKQKWRLSGLVIEIPSVVIASAGIACIMASFIPGLLITIPVSDPSVRIFVEQAILSTGLHIFIPVTVLFFALSLAGRFMRRRGRNK